MDTSELMQYSQFTTPAQMPNKQSGTDVDVGTGSVTDRKLSKWGNVEDFRGVDDGREVDRNINRINDSRNRDKDRDRDRNRGIVAGEVRAVDNDDSAELLSYFEGMYTTKNKRSSIGTSIDTSGPGPVVSRPLSILEESRITAEHSSLSQARVGRTVDSNTASGVTKPLREVIHTTSEYFTYVLFMFCCTILLITSMRKFTQPQHVDRSTGKRFRR